MTATPTQVEHPTLRAFRFGGLDGLRAIAVGVVIAYHLFPATLRGGFIGVDIFFVISGFLITSLLLREHATNGRLNLRSFWVRRARRLLPAIALLVLVTVTAALIVGGDVLVGIGWQVVGAITFSSNWLALAASQSYFDATTPDLLRNLWSLAVEEQFYLLWPLLILPLLLLPRAGRIILMVLLTVASATAMGILFDPATDPTRIYFGTDTHGFGLTLGAALAFATHGRLGTGTPSPDALDAATGQARGSLPARMLQGSGWVAVAGLLAAAALLRDDSAVTYRGGLVVVSVLTALVILAAIQPGSRLARLLDSRPLAWVGERSYGLYLWHWPIIVLAGALFPAQWHDVGQSVLVGLGALALTLVVAELSYRYLEQPIRRHGFRGTFRRVAGWASAPERRPARLGTVTVSAVVVATLVAGTTVAIATAPTTGSVQQQIQAGQDAVDAHPHRTPAPEPSPTENEPADAAPPVIPGGDQITAIGDSVMLASASALQGTFPGIDIDAAVSRQFSAAPALIRAHINAGTLRPVVLLGLGTNGPIDPATLAEVRELLGREHQLILVNVYAPRPWTDGVNVALTGFAQQYRDVELANWRDSISPNLHLLARDQIHPGDDGGAIYAASVEAALQRLAELPPLVGPREFGFAPQPV